MKLKGHSPRHVAPLYSENLASRSMNDKAQGRATVDDFALCPLAQNSTNVLARHIGQGSQVILANPVSDQELVRRPGGFSQMFCKLQQVSRLLAE
jgi:hypothetical protein